MLKPTSISVTHKILYLSMWERHKKCRNNQLKFAHTIIQRTMNQFSVMILTAEN